MSYPVSDVIRSERIIKFGQHYRTKLVLQCGHETVIHEWIKPKHWTCKQCRDEQRMFRKTNS